MIIKESLKSIINYINEKDCSDDVGYTSSTSGNA
jgi:hypothetical protein